METRNIIINDRKYTFVNESKGNYKGFYHKTTLLVNNDVELTTQKIQYYNRTWEIYTFYSVMNKAINTLIEELESDFIKNYKEEYKISRLTQKEMESKRFIDSKELYLKHRTYYNDLLEIKENLKNRR